MKTYEELETLLRRNDIPTDYLKKAIDKGMKSKKKWLKALDLNKKNDFRAVLPIPQSLESLPLALEFLNGLDKLKHFKIIDFQYLQVGKNKVKTTKVISSNWDKIETLSGYESLLCQINTVKVNNGQKEIGHDLGAFLIAWGDYTKNGLVAVVSANPWDYLILADDNDKYCSFSSCVRYNNGGGEYFNTCLYYLASPSVFVGYTADKNDLDKKVGRLMIYVGGFTTVSTNRKYGTISDGAILAMRDYCQQKLSSDEQMSLEGIPQCSRWIVKQGTISDNNAVRNHTGAYIDSGYGVVTVKKDCELESCEIEDGSCLSCGNSLDGSEQYGTCGDCGQHYCYSCGDLVREGDAFYYCDDVYCEGCFDDNFDYCGYCDETFRRNNIFEVHDGRETAYICECCRDSNYTQCNDCNEYFSNNITEIDSGEYVCEECLENYTLCNGCDTYTKECTEVDNEYYCQDCLEDRFKECDHCDEWIPKNDLKDGLCENCQPEEEAVCEQSLTV